jgi:hypothetical protein
MPGSDTYIENFVASGRNVMFIAFSMSKKAWVLPTNCREFAQSFVQFPTISENAWASCDL